ncbi:MAG: phosphoglucosamine mutase [Acidobacteriota bacterium]
MGRYFGTDGVRGVANRELTPELAYQLGRAGAYVLTLEAKHPRILVGKDTRISGDMLESALVAGICSTGADALRAGVIPTPAVAYLTQKYEATCGIVISASHNPMQDNGIKFFGSSGNKLPDEVEEEIENIMLANLDAAGRPEGADIGRVYDIESAERNYIDYLLSCYKPTQNLEGITIVVDCANGAAFNVAPQMWRALGANVIPIFNKPNGININDRCGSTHPEVLKKAVLEYKANIGIAHDGDADRLIAVDEQGNVIDGDQIMVVCGLHMQRTGRLQPSKIVATVMSNIGLEIAFRRESVEIASSSVGDRYVLEKMQETGARLGGEQSGHIIFLDYATTGDGLLSSLKLVEVMRETGMPLSELAREMEKHPQILINLDIKDKDTILNNVGVQDAIRRAQDRLGECGKILVRPSGTEPKVRIMAQGPDESLLQEVVNEIKDAVLQA